MNLISWAVLIAFVGLLGLFWWRKWSIVQALVIANLVAFAIGLVSGGIVTLQGSPILDDLALRPRYLTEPDLLRLHTVLTATFLHADPAHVFGNMLVLWMVGMPFEERVGRSRFLTIYGGSAVVAVVLHALWAMGFSPTGGLDVPVVGASGAVFGILGAFAATYPRDQIPMFLVFILLPRVPVVIAALVMTLIEGVFLAAGQGLDGVARAAHIGGVVGGIGLGLLLKPRQAPGAAGPSGLDYKTLDRLATDARQREIVERLRMNEGHPELQAAWIERLAQALRCPLCGQTYREARRGILRCPRGHEERYAR